MRCSPKVNQSHTLDGFLWVGEMAFPRWDRAKHEVFIMNVTMNKASCVHSGEEFESANGDTSGQLSSVRPRAESVRESLHLVVSLEGRSLCASGTAGPFPKSEGFWQLSALPRPGERRCSTLNR